MARNERAADSRVGNSCASGMRYEIISILKKKLAVVWATSNDYVNFRPDIDIQPTINFFDISGQYVVAQEERKNDYH